MTTTYAADQAETRYVTTESATYAYRRQGPTGGVPLVLVLRFRGTIDHWDPALLDVLAAERDVIVFDNRGLGHSTGTPATSVDGLVDGVIDFLDGLGLAEADLLGWSLGGYIAQGVALRRPSLVRRLVIAGSAPGGEVPDMPRMSARTWEVATKPANEDEDFLYNHALANISGLNDTPVASVTTTAEVTMGRDDRGPAILALHLTVSATAPGMSEELFQDLAERARVGCAFSKALVLEPTMTARLVA